MGCTASYRRINPSPKTRERGISNQDLARSFVSKIGAIRMILKNEDSKSAFINFISVKKIENSQEFLNFYFETEDILRTLPTQVCPKVVLLIKKHKQSGTVASNIILNSLGRLPSLNVETVPVHEVLHHTAKSQTEIFGLMTPIFESFIRSDVYKKWQRSEGENEKLSLLKRKSANSIDVDKLPSCKDRYPNVLIVDESAITAKIASYALTRDGHSVDVIKDGIEALEKLKSKVYDLMLIDVNVSGIDGLELTRLYRIYELDLMKNAVYSNASSPTSKPYAVKKSVTLESLGSPPVEANSNLESHSLDATINNTTGVVTTDSNSVSQKPEIIGTIEAELKTDAKSRPHDPISPISRKSSRLWSSILTSRKPRRVNRLVIIGMGISDEGGLHQMAIDAGMNAFMRKPFNINRFLETVALYDDPDLLGDI